MDPASDTASVLKTPIGGSMDDTNNFGLMSFLATSSEMLERHFHYSFYNYLIEYELLCDLQLGFRKSYISYFTCLATICHYNIKGLTI